MIDEKREALVDEILQSNKCIFATIQAAVTPAWIQLDLTMSQIKGIFLLSKAGALTIGDLAEALGIGRPAASTLVDRLFHLDLVEREEDEEDRRRTFVRLSPNGRRLVEQLHSGSGELFRGWLRELNDADLAALAQGLRAFLVIAMRENSAARQL